MLPRCPGQHIEHHSVHVHSVDGGWYWLPGKNIFLFVFAQGWTQRVHFGLNTLLIAGVERFIEHMD